MEMNSLHAFRSAPARAGQSALVYTNCTTCLWFGQIMSSNYSGTEIHVCKTIKRTIQYIYFGKPEVGMTSAYAFRSFCAVELRSLIKYVITIIYDHQGPNIFLIDSLYELIINVRYHSYNSKHVKVKRSFTKKIYECTHSLTCMAY